MAPRHRHRMASSMLNPCHISKNIIFLISGFNGHQMNMVRETFIMQLR